ncbi:MAG: hypothetical protein U1D30_23225 [Planctomycetota bacterium]
MIAGSFTAGTSKVGTRRGLRKTLQATGPGVYAITFLKVNRLTTPKTATVLTTWELTERSPVATCDASIVGRGRDDWRKGVQWSSGRSLSGAVRACADAGNLQYPRENTSDG